MLCCMVMCVILCVWVLYLTYEVPSIFLSAVIVGVGMSNRRCDDYIHRSVISERGRNREGAK